MAGILGEYTELFLEESEEQIEDLNTNLLELEKDHSNQEYINEIFRAAHSLKSSAAFVGLYNLSDLAHKMENLLQQIRDGKLEVNLSLVNLLFECFDLIKNVIESVQNGKKPEQPFTEMIQKLDDYEKSPEMRSSGPTSGGSDSQDSTSTVGVQNTETGSETSQGNATQNPFDLDDDDLRQIQEATQDGTRGAFILSIHLIPDTAMKGLRFTLILQNLKKLGQILRTFPSAEDLEQGTDEDSLSVLIISSSDPEEIKRQSEVDMVQNSRIIAFDPNEYSESSSAPVEAKEETGKSPAEVVKSASIPHHDSASDQEEDHAGSDGKVVLKSIKVSSDKLDDLMNNVGELVITNSGFQKIYEDLIASFGEDQLIGELKNRIDLINRISKELQTGIMNIRMVPIGNVFRRYTRLVRDLSLETKKTVQLVLKGESTELDKKVIDAIGEPLLHLIRNSVDHGIESPEERKAAGKPETGTVELNAYQGGNNIMVEIRDDGKGLNREKIFQKAVERGLVSESEGANLSDNEVFQYIFAPGFSTADQITDISGRGVGMNVVNKLVQEFKGKILIQSTPGEGCVFTLSFPQALAIIPSILVLLEEEVYAFPLSEVSETIRIQYDQITTLEGNEIINLRGEVLPIYRLNRILGLQDKENQEETPVVIVQYKGRKLGFTVDDLIGKHETVIKSLEKNFKNVQGLTGASIMGDGTIIMVLDIPGLVELSADEEFGTSYKLYRIEPMKRISSIHTADIVDNPYIDKTTNPTNTYNHSLYEQTNQEKQRRKKKEKIQTPQLKSIVVQKEDLEREMSVASVSSNEIQSLPGKSGTTHKQETAIPWPEKHPQNFSSETQAAPKESAAGKKEESYFEHLSNLVGSEATESEKERAKDIIKSFMEQKEERSNRIQPEADFQGSLSKADIKKLEGVVNTGMMNAGMVLSQLLGKNVDLYIPEIIMNDKEGLAEEIRFTDDQFYGLKIRMNGDLNGNLLMMFSGVNARNLTESFQEKGIGKPGEFDEEALSILSEISNIVCSSVINSISNKAKASIMPSVPEFMKGSFLEVLDLVKPERTKFLTMLTEFSQEGNDLLGVLLFLPDFDELLSLIPRF